MENTLIAQELVHTMKPMRGKHGLMMMKLDMEKAYDGMEWCFIAVVLRRFGFPEILVNWIMQCVCLAKTMYANILRKCT